MSFVERFRSSPPRTQLLLWGMLGCVLLVVLVAIYLLILRKSYDVLFNNLRTMDAATIVEQLEKQKTPYRLEDQGTTILVPADMVDQTRLTIMSADLPLKGMVGFELFNKSDMGLTEFAQRINYQRALQGELARTIMTLDSVDTARVHLSLPEQTVFREDRRPPRASVTIQTRPGKVLTASAVHGVQRLVAAAVPDLAIGDVVILDQAGEEVSGASLSAQDLSNADFADQGVESFYAARISEGLAREFPDVPASVQVWADVDVNRIKAPAPTEAPVIVEGGSRAYRLRISILVSAEATAEQRQAIRNAAVTLAGVDLAKGDIIAVTTDTARSASQPIIAAPAPVARPALPTGRGPSVGLGLWVSIGLAVLLAMAAALWAFGRQSPRRGEMSEAERDAMARDLARLLDQRLSHEAV